MISLNASSLIYLKRRVCFGPVCECWLNWSRGAEVGEKRERGNKYKTIELYTRIHPSIPKRSDPYSLYYFLTTTALHCVTLRYTALLSAKPKINQQIRGFVGARLLKCTRPTFTMVTFEDCAAPVVSDEAISNVCFPPLSTSPKNPSNSGRKGKLPQGNKLGDATERRRAVARVEECRVRAAYGGDGGVVCGGVLPWGTERRRGRQQQQQPTRAAPLRAVRHLPCRRPGRLPDAQNGCADRLW